MSTRNLAQHPESIALLHLYQRDVGHEKFPRPVFVHPILKAISDREAQFQPHSLWITTEALSRAVDEVERFCEWLEREIWEMELVGVVTNYFPKPHVAILELRTDLSLGQTIRLVKKGVVHYEQEVASIQVDGTSVPSAPSGTEVGVKVERPVPRNTRILRRATGPVNSNPTI